MNKPIKHVLKGMPTGFYYPSEVDPYIKHLEQRAEAAEAKLAENEKSSGFWGRAAASETIRANKAEAQLAEIAKQAREPVAYTDAEQLNELQRFDFAEIYAPCDSFKSDSEWIPLFTRAAPAADLSGLVPPEADGSNLPFAANGWNACRAEVLRRIEEMK